MKQTKLVELTDEEQIQRGLNILQAIALDAKLKFIVQHKRPPTKEEEHELCEKLSEKLSMQLAKALLKEKK